MAALPHRQSSPSKHSSSSEDAHSIANSTAPLTAAYRPPQKDFGAAFAALQGRYGMGSDLPTPSGGTPPKKKKEQQEQERTPSPRRHSSSHTQPPPAPGSGGRAYQRRPVSIDTARALASQSAVEDESQTPVSDGAASGAGQGDKDTSSSFRWKRLFGFIGKGTPVYSSSAPSDHSPDKKSK
ncbi:hypothetical protein R3P38DRAFT_1658671 [Favolaschia claudopus]|uniref:Uncharacterized protein n=1 Tax=Favolaschia claudopus TaxID=2862362 RepID=A0AAW0AEZ3_9AGAR